MAAQDHGEALEVGFRLAKPEDVKDLAEMEARCYPEDEAASPKAVAFRRDTASSFFMVMFRQKDGEEDVIGFVNSTLSAEDRLSHESMSRHDAEGNHLCIHSVVVDLPYRRRGLGQKMLRHYMARIQEKNPEVKKVSLIAKEHLVGFYCDAGVGLKNLGKSDVVHGKDQWYECSVSLAR